MLKNKPKETFKCYCGNWGFKNAHFEVDDIREKVCRDLPFYGEFNEKQFCVLHYPSKSKVDDFEEVFLERTSEQLWDFRMVYFPRQLSYENEELNKNADFAHATFSEGVDFKHCKFHGTHEFFNAKFEENAYFTLSEFFNSVNFNNVDFQNCGYFVGVKFHKESRPSFSATKFKAGYFFDVMFSTEAKFAKAFFSQKADFSNAEFIKNVDFSEAKFQKGKEADFGNSNFYETVNFHKAEFSEANFSNSKFGSSKKLSLKTIFTNCIFSGTANFQNIKFFNKTNFSKSSFQIVKFANSDFIDGADFSESLFFNDVFFNNSKFGCKGKHQNKTGSVNFDGAEFKENTRVFFDNTWFSWQTIFDYVKFEGYVFFKGGSENFVFDNVFESNAFWGLLSFQNTTIEKPENIYFQTLRLRPSWFVNSIFDLRKINLIDIDWGAGEEKSFTISEELGILEKRVKHNSKKLLSVTFRQLADNAEANSRFEEASKFRTMAFETERLIRKARQEKWWSEEIGCFEIIFRFWEKAKNAPFDLAYYLYRVTSFYGENSSRAFLWLLSIVIVSAIFYFTPLSQFSDKGNFRSLGVVEAAFYSLRVMVLQAPEPPPENLFAKGVVALESILAPLQVALLALAIRRKFMR